MHAKRILTTALREAHDSLPPKKKKKFLAGSPFDKEDLKKTEEGFRGLFYVTSSSYKKTIKEELMIRSSALVAGTAQLYILTP